ncbi:alpha beta-hydrolase [Trichoderma arundinaceum]|uniref:Alpha beta-hydrolase n=1 Tax=Trichoderma arundinaceum TaxID=490622 RepID=A0A395NJP4_TRIAR|nr:alpha beta-hydrolase [Trichoderma arundinaceum]
MSSRTSFVLVPGAWHRAETWDKITSIFEAKGYTCISVTLPSTTGDPTAGLGNDVSAIQKAIQSQTSQGRDVVLIVHSYGGLVGSSSIRGFARKHHDNLVSSSTSSGHVIGMAMMATGFAITGKSFLATTGGKPPPFWIADTETGFATLVADTRDLFYHDVPEEEGNFWVSKLTKHSLKSLSEGGEHVYSGWKDVPCWYLVTLEDHALPADAQKLFVKAAQEDGGDVTMRQVAAGHSPMLSKPKEAAAFVLEAAADFFEKTNMKNVN